MVRNSKDAGQEQLLKDITSLLQKNHIFYMITGSVSVIFYGRPRASHDIDFDKGRFKRRKHLIDAAFVYQIQEKNLDKTYLSKWARKQNTTKLLREITIIDLEQHY